MYTDEERISITVEWLQREFPRLPDLSCMIAEVTELAYMELADLEAIRAEYVNDIETAQEGRSTLFQHLATFEAWYRLTNWVLGQPTPRWVPQDWEQSCDEVHTWAREYAESREAYAPTAPFFVEEWRVAYLLPAPIGDRIAEEIRRRYSLVMDAVAAGTTPAPWWSMMGYSPLVHKVFGDRMAMPIPVLTPQGVIEQTWARG